MMRKPCGILYKLLICIAAVTACVIWCILFYPQQIVSSADIVQLEVQTPDTAKYHNDCLHPCIRRMSDGKYVMVQSPWFFYNDSVENPILYISDDPSSWDKGIVVEGTPVKGYNSDPNVFVNGNRIYVFWREVDTPLCEQLGVHCATVGVYTDDEGKTFSEKKVYLTSADQGVDTEMCPILMKHGDVYRFYATWYETERTNRHNLGVAIWEGKSLDNPDFRLTKTVPFKTKLICDKYKQLKVFGHIFFVPIPHRFDLWHFDLFEKDGKLYMVASEEMGDVIMLAESEDWENFRLCRKPIVNAHYMENHVGYRQQYYKPSAIVQGSDVQVYYTTNPGKNCYTNVLQKTTVQLNSQDDSQLTVLKVYTEPSCVDTIYQVNKRKVPSYALLITPDGDTLYNDSLRYIRARGNWTFTHADKKSFRIKLKQGTEFPNLRKNKDFILLANPFDETFVHNAVAFDLAKAIGIPAPDYTYVTLFMNDEYKGLYQMTNKVEISKRLVDIYNLEKENESVNPLPLDSYPQIAVGEEWQPKSKKGYQLPESPEDITGGYLLRYDWADEYSDMECGFISDGGDAIGITSPRHASVSEVDYIQRYYSDMERAIMDTTNSSYKEYLDVESFAGYYLIQELLMNTDAGIGSMYMYKDVEGKITAGPVWDMDVILNSSTSFDMSHIRYAAKPWRVQGKQTGGILYQLCQRRDFHTVCKRLYTSEISVTWHAYLEGGKIDSLYALLQKEADKDNQLNHTRRSYNYAVTKKGLKSSLRDRLRFLDWYYSLSLDDIVYLEVDSIEADEVLGEDGLKSLCQICFQKNAPIELPQYASTFDNAKTPELVWYITGTDSVLKDGMRLGSDCHVVSRGPIRPSWLTVQKRRLKTRIRRLFL